MAGTQCLSILLLLVLQHAGRTWGRISVDENEKISIRVSDNVDSGALLYKFPHISGYRYLVPNSPDSNFFFLSNAEGLTTAAKLGHLANKTVSLSVCEEVGDVTKVVPVHLRVRSSLTAPTLFGSVAENRDIGSAVSFVNGSLDRALSPYQTPLMLTSQEENRLPDFVLWRNEVDGKWELKTDVKLDYETQRQHKFSVVDPESMNVVAEILVDVENVDDNLPIFNQTRYRFVLLPGVRRFSTAGKVFASDADGDKVVFSFAKTYPCCVVTPQTGEIVVVDIPLFPTHLSVLAHEKDARLRLDKSKIISNTTLIQTERLTKTHNTYCEYLMKKKWCNASLSINDLKKY